MNYGYDALDRLSSLTSDAGVFGYSYAGNTSMLQQVSLPNGSKSEYSYDSLQRLTGVNNRTSTNANISQYGYNYNTRDIRTSMDAQVGSNPLRHINYGYDDVDQLTSEASTEATPRLNARYAYDAMGNRTSVNRSGLDDDAAQTVYASNRLNQITSSTRTDGIVAPFTSALSYDKSGNLTGETYSSGSSTYSYDDADRLTSLVQKTAAGVNDRKSEFVYDGMSRKVLSYEYSWDAVTSSWIRQSDVRRIYDGMDVIREVDGLRQTDAQGNIVYLYKTINYTRDGNIGGLLSKTDVGQNGANDASYFYHYDGSGNVSQLTDSQQNVVATYEYDAYGRRVSFTGPQAASNPYRYSTKEQHLASGLYDYGYRFYSPGLGRWINRDPIRERGGLNLYGAFGNSPTNYVDDYGLIGPAAVYVCVLVFTAVFPHIANTPTSSTDPTYGPNERAGPSFFGQPNYTLPTIPPTTVFGPGHFEGIYTPEERDAIREHERWHREEQGWWQRANPFGRNAAESDAWDATERYANRKKKECKSDACKENYEQAENDANWNKRDYGWQPSH